MLMIAQVEDVGAEKDAVTRLRAPTHYGRPKWDSLFQAIGDQHPKTDVGVVCPLPLEPIASPHKTTVLLWSSCPVEGAASHVQQAFTTRWHTILLWQGKLLKLFDAYIHRNWVHINYCITRGAFT